MNCQELRYGVDSCRHTAGIDRKLAVEVGKIARRTVDCASDKDTGAVDEDIETLQRSCRLLNRCSDSLQQAVDPHGPAGEHGYRTDIAHVPCQR